MNLEHATIPELRQFRSNIDLTRERLTTESGHAASIGARRELLRQLAEVTAVGLMVDRQLAHRTSPAGAVVAPETRLGIYQATAGRRLFMSRALRIHPSGAPELSIATPNGPITVTNPAPTRSAGSVIWGALAVASMGASAYHGVKRNHGSIGYGIWWGLMGSLFPVITPAVALAQGFGKPAPR